MTKKKKDDNSNGNNSNVFAKKWAKILGSDRMDEISGYSEEELKAKLINAERSYAAIEADMSSNLDIIKLKDDLKLQLEPYRDDMNAYEAVIKYICFIMEERQIKND